MNKKIRKFTYSFLCGSWSRMFGGVIWSEDGEYLLPYLYNYYNPDPHELMVATAEEKNRIESIINEIVYSNSMSKNNQSYGDDEANIISNRLDFLGDIIESDYVGYGECTVIYENGEKVLSPIDEISIQVLDDIIKKMKLVRECMNEAQNDDRDALLVNSLDIKKKRKQLYSIIYDITVAGYFIYNHEKMFGNIKMISKRFVENLIAVFQQRTDFSYAPIHLEINKECFLFGSEFEQTKIETLAEDICNDDLFAGPVKVAVIKQEIIPEDIILLVVMRNPNIIKGILKNGDVFFSKRCDLITVHNPQLNELEMINKNEGFALYKRWNESWVKYLGQHLSTIKNWTMKSNHDVRGELVNVYYLVNNHLARLGAYSDGVVNWFPEDEDAIGVLSGMMKNNSLFWE